MTPEQIVLVEGLESLASLCLHLRRMSDSQGDQIDVDRLFHCADLIEAQAAEIERLRAALTAAVIEAFDLLLFGVLENQVADRFETLFRATGPMTGDPIRDLVQCPACSFIAMHDTALKGGTQ